MLRRIIRAVQGVAAHRFHKIEFDVERVSERLINTQGQVLLLREWRRDWERHQEPVPGEGGWHKCACPGCDTGIGRDTGWCSRCVRRGCSTHGSVEPRGETPSGSPPREAFAKDGFYAWWKRGDGEEACIGTVAGEPCGLVKAHFGHVPCKANSPGAPAERGSGVSPVSNSSLPVDAGTPSGSPPPNCAACKAPVKTAEAGEAIWLCVECFAVAEAEEAPYRWELGELRVRLAKAEAAAALKYREFANRYEDERVDSLRQGDELLVEALAWFEARGNTDAGGCATRIREYLEGAASGAPAEEGSGDPSPAQQSERPYVCDSCGIAYETPLFSSERGDLCAVCDSGRSG